MIIQIQPLELDIFDLKHTERFPMASLLILKILIYVPGFFDYGGELATEFPNIMGAKIWKSQHI